MARRKKSSRKNEPVEAKKMNPETVRGLLTIGLIALSALLFLSYFGIAGSFGYNIDSGMAMLFGWDRFLLPIWFVIYSATLLFPERGHFTLWNTLGILLFFLGFNALLNLCFVAVPFQPAALLAAGGQVGQFLNVPLAHTLGFWGCLVVLGALLVSAVLLIFNTSLRSMLTVHKQVTGWLGERAERNAGALEDDWRTSEIETESEVEEPHHATPEPEPEPEEEEEEKVEVPKKPFKKVEAEGSIPEQVLMTREQRHINLSLDLLDNRSTKANSGNTEKAKEIIQRTFQQFHIDVEMGDTTTGPTVTQYTLRPAQGVKLSRIIGLQNDLALALAAHPLRVEAPIPGKSLVGIEVPNLTVATVSLREIMESKQFTQRKSNLSIPLGKDVMGQSWVVPLDKMPHLLVAGATGSGKSVCLNTLILGLLYENGPDELKLILVDPKRVELSVYEGIPHLLIPPIIKADDTVNALKWTVREMERRLDVLSKFGARDITSYNDRAEEKMPKIVVIIDELADLMSTSGHEVEATIVRIAQMSRAVGIHLVLATQRPSVDVITGTIKANIPARIAFSVASQTDSRTILDVSGAEKLLGRGDMLYWSAELSKPKRLQGPFVSEDEVARIVAALKKESVPDYNYAITEVPRSATIMGANSEDEPLLEEAIKVVMESRKASTSLLQRRLKVGYGRAARLIDLMEEQGIVSAGDGSKPREILIEEWPPGGNVAESIPTAQDDLNEAAEQIPEPEPPEEMPSET